MPTTLALLLLLVQDPEIQKARCYAELMDATDRAHTAWERAVEQDRSWLIPRRKYPWR